MHFSKHIDQLVQNSECFSFDAYNLGLRRYLKHRVLMGRVGSVEDAEINPNKLENHPIALVLGHTNRMYSRYPLIKDLLDRQVDVKNDKSSKYYKTLFRFYESQNLINKYKGHLEIKRKINRIKIIDAYLKNHKSLDGIDAHLRRRPYNLSVRDYPINLIYDLDQLKNVEIQLDGSHRRCICFYNGFDQIKSINVKISEILEDIHYTHEPYLIDHLTTYLNIIRFTSDA